jgi:hypothetical protein
MSDEIIYPSIDLFLYDLKDGLGQDKEKVKNNCEQFCKKIYGNLDPKNFQTKFAQIQKHQHTDADALELLETRYQEFPSPLDGWYYPLQFSDTYCLQVNYSGKLDANHNPNNDKQKINDEPFLKLKQEIEKRISDDSGTIGQTWLLWGKLTDNKSDSELEKIAKLCYTQIVSNYDWNKATL